MAKLGSLPEFQKPPVVKPVITTLADIDPYALEQLVGYLANNSPEIPATSVVGLGAQFVGGSATQTPGAVATVNIAHGLPKTPTIFSVVAGDADSRGAPAMYVTADSTNLVLNFAANLTPATAYTWVWTAG